MTELDGRGLGALAVRYDDAALPNLIDANPVGSDGVPWRRRALSVSFWMSEQPSPYDLLYW